MLTLEELGKKKEQSMPENYSQRNNVEMAGILNLETVN